MNISRLLIRHQDVLARLKKEIETVLGGQSIINRAQIQQMPFLKNVLIES